MKEIITSTRPNADGEILWWVTFRGSYYDNDPRGPSTRTVGKTVHVLARDHAEAIQKSAPWLAEAKDQSDDVGDITAGVVTLEELVVCKRVQKVGFYGNDLSPITLTDPRDAQRYGLAVCLVPVP